MGEDHVAPPSRETVSVLAEGVCGSGKFPQDNSKKWSPETQSDSNTEWGNYWECPAGDTTPEHGAPQTALS